MEKLSDLALNLRCLVLWSRKIVAKDVTNASKLYPYHCCGHLRDLMNFHWKTVEIYFRLEMVQNTLDFRANGTCQLQLA